MAAAGSSSCPLPPRFPAPGNGSMMGRRAAPGSVNQSPPIVRQLRRTSRQRQLLIAARRSPPFDEQAPRVQHVIPHDVLPPGTFPVRSPIQEADDLQPVRRDLLLRDLQRAVVPNRSAHILRRKNRPDAISQIGSIIGDPPRRLRPCRRLCLSTLQRQRQRICLERNRSGCRQWRNRSCSFQNPIRLTQNGCRPFHRGRKDG